MEKTPTPEDILHRYLGEIQEKKEQIQNEIEAKRAVLADLRELEQRTQRMLGIKTEPIPVSRGYIPPLTKLDRALAVLRDELGGVSQAAEWREALQKYEGFEQITVNNSQFDGITNALRGSYRIASVKYNNNNKLQWWLTPEHLEQVVGGYKVLEGVVKSPLVEGLNGVVSYKSIS